MTTKIYCVCQTNMTKRPFEVTHKKQNKKKLQQKQLHIILYTMTNASIAKRVRFYPGVSLSSGPGLQLDEEEIQHLWHCRQELAVFKMECRIAIACRDGGVDESNKENIPRDHEEQMTEQGIGHCCRKRMKYAMMTRKCILSATKQNASPEMIAEVARRCNTWSIQASYIHAAETFYSLYMPEFMSELPCAPTVPASFPYSVKGKRKQPASAPAAVVETQRMCMWANNNGTSMSQRPHKKARAA